MQSPFSRGVAGEGWGEAGASSPEGARLTELAEILERERTTAFEAGRQAALEAMQDETVRVAVALGDAAQALEAKSRALFAEAEEELLDLAFDIARRIVQGELDEHPARWLDLVAAGIRRVRERGKVQLRLGPLLHAWMVGHLGELRQRLGEVRLLEVVEDPGLGPAGCLAETATGAIDLTIDAQLDVLRTAAVDGAD